MKKDKIPPFYIREYGVHNLYVLRLDSACRLIYTLIFDGVGISINIVEVFLDHKQYERRFRYT